ncbi:NADH dehydrogenase (ubiquinone) MWFE subunit [Lycorma delicatula]|uniref:NADH dehydrogenase (ubiquinone) MWFE subunit n=1 Tax=Lycorma delicatula TaxID=130591 RepID=UPI003F51062C
MWYEILPSAAVIYAGLFLPVVSTWAIHKLFQNGNPYRRDRNVPFNMNLILRDEEVINGNTYVLQGLEAIPDE